MDSTPMGPMGVLAESGAQSRNKQGESREPGKVESGIKEARVGKQEGGSREIQTRVGKQEGRESGNTDQSRETRGAGVGKYRPESGNMDQGNM